MRANSLFAPYPKKLRGIVILDRIEILQVLRHCWHDIDYTTCKIS